MEVEEEERRQEAGAEVRSQKVAGEGEGGCLHRRSSGREVQGPGEDQKEVEGHRSQGRRRRSPCQERPFLERAGRIRSLRIRRQHRR